MCDVKSPVYAQIWLDIRDPLTNRLLCRYNPYLHAVEVMDYYFDKDTRKHVKERRTANLPDQTRRPQWEREDVVTALVDSLRQE